MTKVSEKVVGKSILNPKLYSMKTSHFIKRRLRLCLFRISGQTGKKPKTGTPAAGERHISFNSSPQQMAADAARLQDWTLEANRLRSPLRCGP